VANANIAASLADGEVDARILEHPLRIVALEYAGLEGKERAVEADRSSDVLDADMHMESFHLKSLIKGA
jgi:hypothetical protein